MLVDYVRVYTRNPQPATKAGAPYLDSEMWVSSERGPRPAYWSGQEGRPLSSPTSPSPPKSEPAK
jgi:hypothetical protein